MAAAGMRISSHTHTHQPLSVLQDEAVLRELVESRQRLEDGLGESIDALALPGGSFPSGWNAERFAAAGYRWVATSRAGPNRQVGCYVRRYTVRRSTTLRSFEFMFGHRRQLVDFERAKMALFSGVRAAIGWQRYARYRRWLLEKVLQRS
jgi:peptidoglycan/xylan/chitin deacetylase (PgdA/CDA1 family)